MISGKFVDYILPAQIRHQHILLCSLCAVGELMLAVRWVALYFLPLSPGFAFRRGAALC
jgi:hypothetical protein